MAKRLTDTEKWERPWFRSLPPKYKLLWCYILDKCDIAGVWYLDLDLTSFLIGENFQREEAEKFLEKQIEIHNDRWLIKDFIAFQYGNLSETNKLHNNVVSKIKSFKEGAFMGHISPINGVKNKNKDKDIYNNVCPKTKYLDHVFLTTDEFGKLVARFGEKIADEWIDRLNNYLGSTGRNYKSHYHTILTWANKDHQKIQEAEKSKIIKHQKEKFAPCEF